MKLSQAEIIKSVLETMLETKGIVGYKIARNLRMINEELIEYENVKRELFKKYGREENNQLIIDKDSENYPLFLGELKPYEDMEVNFDFRKISEEELENSELTANQMMFLMEYFEGEI